MLPITDRAPEDSEEPKPADKAQSGCIPSCVKGLLGPEGADYLVGEENTFDSNKVQS